MAKQQPGVMFYFEIRPALTMLSLEQKGRLFECILDYGQYAVVPDFGEDQLLQMAWGFISPRLDKDRERYEEISKRRAEAGRKGGHASGEARKREPELMPKPEKQHEANEAFASFVKQTKPTTTTNSTTNSNSTTTTNSDPTKGLEGNAKGNLKPTNYDAADIAFEKLRAEKMAMLGF